VATATLGRSNVELPCRAGDESVLKVSHHLQDRLGQFSSTLVLLNRDFVGLVFVHEGLDGSYYCGGTSTEGLVDPLLLACAHEFLYFKGLG
jgi:hypothetical protein